MHKSIQSEQQITPCTVLSHFISYASQWYNKFHKNTTVQILSVHHFSAASLSCKIVQLKLHIWETREHDASGWGGCNSNDPACCSMQMQKVNASDFTNHKVIASGFTDTNYKVVGNGFTNCKVIASGFTDTNSKVVGSRFINTNYKVVSNRFTDTNSKVVGSRFINTNYKVVSNRFTDTN